MTFNDNGTLSAVPKHPLLWMPELSGGRKEDDILILPNIALLVSFPAKVLQYLLLMYFFEGSYKIFLISLD